MSTEHQQYSTSNQEDAIRDYAARRGYQIVCTYADEGKSGLNVSGRVSLRRLIEDVQSKNPGFAAILVYDVSRWGRFQNADESAYYEYLCKRAGIDVHYCAEQFENDGGPTSTIIKSVKRAMAGEYSRELSNKVFKGQCRLIELGYRQGGPPGYGLRRMLLNAAGETKAILHRGEQKSLQTDRVVLAPGPEDEVAVVRRIYRLFVEAGRSESEIAKILNEEGVLTDFGRCWNRGTVSQVLTNEKYIGQNVYNRTSQAQAEACPQSPRDVGPQARCVSFSGSRRTILHRARNSPGAPETSVGRRNDRRIAESGGREPERFGSADRRAEGLPTSAAYRSRFGSLLQAYRLARCEPPRDFDYVEINRRLCAEHSRLMIDLMHRLTGIGASVSQDSHSGLLLINREFSASVVLSRCRRTAAGSLRWAARFDGSIVPDITILVRMDESNQRPVDYYLLPVMDMPSSRLLLCETNAAYLDTYQFVSLDAFTSLAARQSIEIVV